MVAALNLGIGGAMVMALGRYRSLELRLFSYLQIAVHSRPDNVSLSSWLITEGASIVSFNNFRNLSSRDSLIHSSSKRIHQIWLRVSEVGCIVCTESSSPSPSS